MTDLYATETHFLDHLVPVWRALPAEARGRAFVAEPLVVRARELELDVDVADPVGAAPILVASYGDLKRVRAHGRRRIAFLEHGAGQSYAGDPRTALVGNYPGGVDRDDVGLFLVPNEQAAWRWHARYPDARVAVVGSPRLDDLPGRAGAAGRVLAISFHWDCRLAPETGSAIHEYRWHLAGLVRDLRARGIEVIGHGHPRRREMAVTWKRVGVEYVRPFEDVCRRADVYACDNSSTLFEFAATGRPVVVINSTRYRRPIRHGGRFWDWAGVGLNVDRPDDFVAAAELAFDDREWTRSERELVLAKVYQPRHGGAAAAAAELVAFGC